MENLRIHNLSISKFFPLNINPDSRKACALAPKHAQRHSSFDNKMLDADAYPTIYKPVGRSCSAGNEMGSIVVHVDKIIKKNLH
jgi:hypothetical protein